MAGNLFSNDDYFMPREYKYSADPFMPIILGKKRSIEEAFQQTKHDIKSILVSKGKVMTISELRYEFLYLFHEPIPVRECGYGSLKGLLKRMTDICEIDFSEEDPEIKVLNKEKSEHIWELASRNMSKRKEVRGKFPDEEKHFSKVVFIPFYIQDKIREILLKSRYDLPIEVFYDNISAIFPLKLMCLDIGVHRLVESLPHLLAIIDGKVKLIVKPYEKVPAKPKYLPQQWLAPLTRTSPMELQVAENLKTLLSENCDGIYLQELPHKYMVKFSSEIRTALLGFHEFRELVLLLPVEFQMYRMVQDYVLFPKDHCVKHAVDDCKNIDPKIYCGNDALNTIMHNIQELAFDISGGVEVNQFRGLFEYKIRCRLLLEEFNIQWLAFVKKIADEYVITLKEMDGKLFIYPNDGWPFKKCPVSEEEEVPSFAVQRGEIIENFKMPLINGSNICVFIAEVTYIEDPSNFFLRIVRFVNNGLEFSEDFHTLHKDMQLFYAQHFCDYIIPVDGFKMNMVCAAVIKGMWNRCKIVNLRNSNELWVSSLDVGGIHKVSKNSVLYLDVQHAQLEVHTFKATLCAVQPVDYKWSLDAIKEFCALSLGKKLLCISKFIDEKGTLFVDLKDGDRQTGIFLHQTLIDRGIAIAVDDDRAFY